MSRCIFPTLGSGGTQWGPVELMCPWLCLSVSLSFCLSVYLSIYLSVCRVVCISFWKKSPLPVIACSSYVHRTWVPQYNIYRSIICPYVCTSVQASVCRPFAVFLFVFISSVGVQSRGVFIPTLGYRVPQWGPVYLICPSVFLCVSLYLFLSVWSSASHFGNHKSVARNFAQSMRPEATGSNPLSVSIICPSVCSVVRGPFDLFFLYSIFLIIERDDYYYCYYY